MKGADYLAALLDDLMCGHELSVLSHSWLQRSLLVYLRAGGAISLDAAMGLSESGRRSAHRLLATEIRNQHLRDAADTISLDVGLSEWARCCRLADEVSRLVPVFATTYRKATRPPADWPAWKRALFHAWRTGPALPETARGLHKALNRPRWFSVQSGGLKVVASYTTLDARHERNR